MLFTNLTPVSPAGRAAGRFATFALAALLTGAVAAAQSSNPAPGTAPMQQPSTGQSSSSTSQSNSSSSSSSSSQTTSGQAAGQSAPGTAPIKSHNTAAELAPGKGPSYNNRWDIYGGLAYANGQAGQNLPKRYDMGGAEGQFTYWLLPKLGVAGDYRWGGGTTPVNPIGANYGYNRVLVMQNIFAGGVQYRGPKNRYVAINYHAFAGGDDGIFDHAVTHYPGGSPLAACPVEQPGQQGNLGLYCNHIAPWAAVGGSIDFNQGPKLAVRLSPDLTLEHFGTETRVFVGVSLGLVYRGGRH